MTTIEPQPILSHAKLDVYRCAAEFLAFTTSVVLPKGNGDLADQLRRASVSILLNIAEGAGKVTLPDKRKHYAIARGSALECCAILDAARILSLIDSTAALAGNRLLTRIVAMLTKLAR